MFGDPLQPFVSHTSMLHTKEVRDAVQTDVGAMYSEIVYVNKNVSRQLILVYSCPRNSVLFLWSVSSYRSASTPVGFTAVVFSGSSPCAPESCVPFQYGVLLSRLRTDCSNAYTNRNSIL